MTWTGTLRSRAFWRTFGLIATFGEIVLLAAILALVKTGGLFGLW